MSTFLELVQDTAIECDVTGSITTVIGQTGESARLVRWVKQAYLEIQNMNGGRWRWLRHDFTFDTTVDKFEYSFGEVTDVQNSAFITRFSSWYTTNRHNPPKQFLTSGGEAAQTWMINVGFDEWRNVYDIGIQNSGSPIHIAISPRDTILIGPKPTDIYTIRGEYWQSPQILALDADVPDMPIQFHQLIVYKAMEKYAGQEAAQEVMVRAHNEGTPMLRQLRVNQAPRFSRRGPLA